MSGDAAVSGDAAIGTCPQQSFSPPMLYGTGVNSNATAVAVADFNRDGRIDLAVANGTETRVIVLLGNGDGSFQPAAFYGAAYDSESIAAGDFNGDGKPDLAATSSGSTVSVLLGNGDGTFQTYASVAAGAYQWWIAARDVNADAKLDLVTANFNSADVSVLLGNGNGTFQTNADYPLEPGANAVSVALDDVNGDGRSDIIAVGLSGTPAVSVLVGNGDGTFQPYVNFGTGNQAAAVTSGDLNHDGKTDIVVAEDFNNADVVGILLGNGDGSFQAVQTFSTAPGPRSVVIVDVDGDGNQDVVTANDSGPTLEATVSILRGNGDGTFQGQVAYAAGAEPWSVATGDFDGDGRPDLAVADLSSQGVSILLNTCLP